MTIEAGPALHQEESGPLDIETLSFSALMQLESGVVVFYKDRNWVVKNVMESEGCLTVYMQRTIPGGVEEEKFTKSF